MSGTLRRSRHPLEGERGMLQQYGDPAEYVSILKVRGHHAKVRLNCGRRVWVLMEQIAISRPPESLWSVLVGRHASRTR